jgi:replicative DNA helicase
MRRLNRKAPTSSLEGIKSVVAEKSVLGSILLQPELLSEAQAILKAEDFSLDSHRRIFRGMAWLGDHGKPLDLVTLSDFLSKHKQLATIGGSEYLSGLLDGVPDRISVAHHAEIVLEKCKLRALVHTSISVQQKVTEGIASANEIIGEVEDVLIRVLKRGGSKQESIFETGSKIVQRLWMARKEMRPCLGFSSSLPDLDELTGGVRDHEYVIIAARTGHGKSSLASQMAVANAQTGKKVGVYSFEMTKENLVERMASTISGVDFNLIRDPRYMPASDMERVAEAIKAISELPIRIDDSAGLDITELTARIRSNIMQGEELCIVDYLQLVHCKAYKETYDRVTAVSAALRDLAKITGVPVVALAQLRRPEQGRENREPTIYDLKESGNIENDAFQIWLIYRPQERDERDNWNWSGKDKIIVGKNRNGPLGNVMTVYDGRNVTFRPRQAEPETEKAKEPNTFEQAYKQGRLNVEAPRQHNDEN